MYCPKCGSNVYDEINGCPRCGYKPIIDVKPNREESHTIYDNEPVINEGLSTILKIIIVAAVILLPAIGPIIAIISGIILLGSASADMRAFGKLLLNLGIAIIALSIICCCISSLTNFGFFHLHGWIPFF